VSIEQSNLVDFIGTDNATGWVVLTISDHLNWDQEDEHLVLLQTKLNTYLAFIESGEIAERYPTAVRNKIRFEIVTQYHPSNKALDFLQKAQSVVEDAGFSLSWRLLKNAN
jgi:hypothetical protein